MPQPVIAILLILSQALRGDRAELGSQVNVAAVVDAPAQRFLDHVGLLEDLLEHEMFEAALLGGSRVPGDQNRLALDAIPRVIGEAKTVASDDRDLALLQDDFFARVRQNRRRIGCDVHFAVTDADDERTRAIASKDEMIGIVARYDAERVGAANFMERAAYRLFEVAVVVQLDQMREDLGIGFAAKNVAELDQARSQGGVVFDDAVVNDRDLAAAVHVRMCVGVGRRPVRCPASMSDADDPGKLLAVIEPLGEPGEFSLGFRTRQGSIGVDDGDAGAIVSPVLQAPQRVQNDRDAVPLADISDNPAHGTPPCSARRGPRMCFLRGVPALRASTPPNG